MKRAAEVDITPSSKSSSAPEPRQSRSRLIAIGSRTGARRVHSYRCERGWDVRPMRFASWANSRHPSNSASSRFPPAIPSSCARFATASTFRSSRTKTSISPPIFRACTDASTASTCSFAKTGGRSPGALAMIHTARAMGFKVMLAWSRARTATAGGAFSRRWSTGRHRRDLFPIASDPFEVKAYEKKGGFVLPDAPGLGVREVALRETPPAWPGADRFEHDAKDPRTALVAHGADDVVKVIRPACAGGDRASARCCPPHRTARRADLLERRRSSSTGRTLTGKRAGRHRAQGRGALPPDWRQAALDVRSKPIRRCRHQRPAMALGENENFAAIAQSTAAAWGLCAAARRRFSGASTTATALTLLLVGNDCAKDDWSRWSLFGKRRTASCVNARFVPPRTDGDHDQAAGAFSIDRVIANFA